MEPTWWFLSASDAAAGARKALAAGDISSADRFVAEVSSRVLLAPDGAVVPGAIVSEPASTGDIQYDTLLATALAFALASRGMAAPAWSVSVRPLDREWMWDGGYGAGGAFRDFVRARTPALFLAKNLLLREQDLISP